MEDNPDEGGAPRGAKRSHLGRGLAALFGEENEDYAALDRVRSTKSVPIEQLYPNARQPRHHFDAEAVAALAQSIEANGILQPILVRRHPEHGNAYEIVAGERRWRAAQQARLHEVPVIIRELTDLQALELAIVENVQRQDLTPVEEAEGYRRLIEEFGHRQEDLARTVGKSRSHITNCLRLLGLPDEVKEMIARGDLTAGHARALIGAPDPVALAKAVVRRGLSVRKTEELARSAKPLERPARGGRPAKAAPRKDADTLALERDLSQLLGLKVSIELKAGGNGESGTLTVHYDNLEQLDGVLRRLTQLSVPEAE